MGMVWVARLADAAQVEAIKAAPDTAINFVCPDDYENYRAEMIDLDKEWHAVHHLLTGSADVVDSPLSLILGNFEEVGGDNGYGPVYYVPPSFLQAFSSALSARDSVALRASYDPDRMVRDDIYIGDMYQEEGEQGFAFLLERVEALREFAEMGARTGRGAFWVIT